MANYRFKTTEIEAMKKNILTQIEREAETKTAWRLRCAIEGQLMCCRPSKREAARLERELALYEKLTKNDLPNWQSEPTQPATPAETPQISTETAETVNVSAEGENEPQAAKYKPYTTRAEIIALLESEHGIEYDAGEVVYLKDGCVAEDLSDEGEWRIYLDADSDKCIDVIAIQPPQSPETPQTVEYTTDTLKPRETARKRQNRAIGSAQHHQCSALGANGYAVLNDASATMAAMNVRCDTLRDTLRSVTHVPRECSTVDAAHW